MTSPEQKKFLEQFNSLSEAERARLAQKVYHEMQREVRLANEAVKLVQEEAKLLKTALCTFIGCQPNKEVRIPKAAFESFEPPAEHMVVAGRLDEEKGEYVFTLEVVEEGEGEAGKPS